MVNSDLKTNTQHSDPYFLSCDWGTTNFRLHLAERRTGNIVTGIETPVGIKKIYKKWSRDQKQDRVAFYLSYLDKQISVLQKKSSYELTHLPVIISGMASSSIGIKELPYQQLPVTLNNPDLKIEKLDTNIYLISGIRSEDDIMRGEETQLLGLAVISGVTDGLFLLGGTHSKHVFVEDGNIVDFKTYMTGELFNLICSESILSESVSTDNDTSPGPAFEEGVNEAVRENILHALFQVRTRDLLQNATPKENTDYLSGLLIGTEMAALHKDNPQQVILSGSDNLQEYYARACDVLQLNYSRTAFGADITAAGHHIILQKIIGQ